MLSATSLFANQTKDNSKKQTKIKIVALPTPPQTPNIEPDNALSSKVLLYSLVS